MKEILPGIYSIREAGNLGAMKPPENIYVLAGKNGLIYDAGYGSVRAIKYLMKQINKIAKLQKERDLPFNLTRVLPSHAHPDHFSGLKMIRNHLNVKIVLTRRMAEILKNKHSYYYYYQSEDIYRDEYFPKSISNVLRHNFREPLMKLFYKGIYGLSFIDNPDIIIEENTSIDINGEEWQIFHSPGHSSDHISLYHEEKGILFSGDNILRTITTWLGPPNSNIEQYLSTIKKIQRLPNLEIILPSHGSPITSPKARIKELLEHRENRKNQVLEIINSYPSRGITVESLIEKFYPGQTKFMHGVARGWIILTLDLLKKRNLIEQKSVSGHINFFPNN
ncbi:MAG: MBL fold metallo-hydrolase [Candidatus Lokiarchaeota archaeon]|nr:MBL fold metallo-hydrolase [Candidatus Lokiarchaeota archaeon]MBD3200018.1 MBL fold metallo-hydrolase [Candidatus Lokiarchaeota archaeon]